MKKTCLILIFIISYFLSLNLNLINAVVLIDPSTPSSDEGVTGSYRVSNSSISIPKVDLGNTPLLQQNFFNSSEIDLTHGTIFFTEIDLKIPGINNFDLVISRTYNSKMYTSTPQTVMTFDTTPWGKWIGHGWSFNFGMRAYYVPNKKVVIDSELGLEEFRNPETISSYTVKYKSTKPGSFKYVLVSSPQLSGGAQGEISVTLVDEAGKRYGFMQFCFEGYPKIRGYYLNSISDVQGKNTITIEYEPYYCVCEENDFVDTYPGEPKKLTYILGTDAYDGISVGYLCSINLRRPKYIIDTYGNRIEILYKADRSLKNDDTLIREIKYTNTNGMIQSIYYNYDSNDNLISVQKGNLPPTNYTYIYFIPPYRIRNISIRGNIILNPPYKYQLGLKTYDTTDLNDNPCAEEISTNKLKGYILTSIETSLKSKIEYEYKYDMYNVTVVMSDPYTEIANPGGSYPVVIKKSVKKNTNDPTPDIIYSYSYPSNLTKYTLPNSTIEAYYFRQVTVDNPNQIQDETFYFDKGFLTKHTKGVFESTQEWDYANNRITSVTELKNRTVQGKKYYFYTGEFYNNLSGISYYKGNSNSPYKTESFSYYQDISLINNNLLHLLKAQTIKDCKSYQNLSSSYTYDSYGRLTAEYKRNYPAGTAQKTITYDDRSRPKSISQLNSAGQYATTALSYSLSGREYTILENLNGKTSKSIYSVYTNDLLSEEDVNGNKTTYTYDSYSRPLTVTYPNNSQESISYSSDLKMITKTKNGLTSILTLDNFGRVLSINNPDGIQDSAYSYYFGDAISSVYKDNILKKEIEYDAYLRSVKVTNITGSGTSLVKDTTTLSYNDSNNSVTITSPSGKTTQTYQDELGRTTQKILPDSSSLSTEYDAFDHAIQQNDPENSWTKFVYDDDGRYLIKVLDSYGTSRIMEYYDNGSLKSTLAYDQNTFPFKKYEPLYNAENRPAGYCVNGTQVEWITYDASSASNGKDRVTSVENDSVKTEYQYDTMGRITQEKKTFKHLNKTYTISQEYGTDTLKAIKYNDGKAINYEYDSVKRLQSIKYNDQSIAMINHYNANSTIQKMTLGNGITIQYEYVKDKLLQKITVKKNDAILYQQTYTYDAGNNITTTTHTDFLKEQADISRKYTYNQRNFLTSTSIKDNLTYSYNYDKNGNHLKYETPDNKNIGQDNITLIPATNRIEYKTFKDGRKIKLAYDPEGNMIKKESFQGTHKIKTTTYVYNYQNQLAEVKVGTASIALYQYDHHKQRVYKYLPQTQKGYIYYWDIYGHIIGEGLLNGAEHHVRYIYFGNEKIAMVRNENGIEKLYYFVNNAQGTPVMILDSQGKTISKINLDEWGNIGKVIGTKAEINFTGKKLDTETGLYYFNQRYYDPEIGRFLTEDPEKQYLTPYLYCSNNPLSYIDPDGEWVWLIGMVVGGVLGGALNNWKVESIIMGAAMGALTGYMIEAHTLGGVNLGGLFQGANGNSVFAGINISGKGIAWTAGAGAGGFITSQVIGSYLYKKPEPYRPPQDGFAHYVLNEVISKLTRDNHVEYGSVIYRDDKSGKFGYTEPARGSIDQANVNYKYKDYPGTTPVAIIHSHVYAPEKTLLNPWGTFSDADKELSDQSHLDGYLWNERNDKVYYYDAN